MTVTSATPDTIRFQFAGQLRLEYESKDGGSGNERTGELDMYARRIRAGFIGKFPQRHLDVRLQLSAAPNSLEFMDGYFDYYRWLPLRFRVGQFKVPFTRYRIHSFQRLTFVDWSILTKYFGAERQMGGVVHNDYENPPKWGYALGIFTGVNARASHAIGIATLYGEETPNPSDLSSPTSRADFHPEVFIHGSYNPSKMTVSSDTDDKWADLRFFGSLSGAWDLDPNEYQDFALRFASEVLIKYRGLSCTGIGYLGFSRTGSSAVTRLAMTGGLVQSAWRISKLYEVAVRYAIVDFDDTALREAYERAQDIIATAQLELDTASEKELARQHLNNVTSQYGSVGDVSRQQEITLGFNVYWNDHKLKWQNDVGWLIHSRSDGNRTDVTVRSQVQLAF
ncbi:MAG: porin [Candidatus Zixiibacteriota bacterium]